MGDIAELDAAFHRLLLDDDARSRLEHDPASLGWSPRVTTLMHAAGAADFRRLGQTIVKGVGSGALCGVNLRDSFRATLTAMRPVPADEALQRFVASAEFRRVRAVGNEAGFSPARAFYQWLCAADARPGVRMRAQHDYIQATLRMLATTGSAYFAPDDPLIRTVDGGWITVLDGRRQLVDAEMVPEMPVAAGAVRGRVWSVSLSHRSAAALLRAARTPPQWAAQLPDGAARRVTSAMRARGML